MNTASQLAILVLATSNLSAATLYVSLESTNPVAPYAAWDTAATNIQNAVDAAQVGDTVLVTNGVYAVGGRTNEWGYGGNRVTVTASLRLESVNGPRVTTINGGGTVRCVYLAKNALLSGFTLAGGSAGAGGGVFSESSGVVTNCVLTGNSATDACAGYGGGAYGVTLYDCTLTGNSATLYGAGGALGSKHVLAEIGPDGAAGHTGTGHGEVVPMGCADFIYRAYGGGASHCTLYNCTLNANDAGAVGGAAYASALYNCVLTGNSAYLGGGAYRSTLRNCVLTGNSAEVGGGALESTLYNCTVIGNDGGGVNLGSTAFNSIIYYNSGGNYDDGYALNYCLTAPLPTGGAGNITGPPLFMDMAAGDFRLREDSPCIDAGTNLLGMPIAVWSNEVGDWVVGPITDPTDILGNTRFIDGNCDGKVAWDIGAYEFNSFKPPRFPGPPIVTASEDPNWGWVRNVRLTITGAPNRRVRVLRSSDLREWTEIGQSNVGADGVTQFIDLQTEWEGDYWEGEEMMFYRAMVP